MKYKIQVIYEFEVDAATEAEANDKARYYRGLVKRGLFGVNNVKLIPVKENPVSDTPATAEI